MSGRQFWSNWHITVNANRHEKTHKARMETAQLLSDAVATAIREPQHLWYWLRYFHNKEQKDFPEKMKQRVERIRARCALEMGGKANNRSVHVHIMLEVQHRTRVQIDPMRFQEVLEKITGLSGFNTLSRFVRGNGEDKEYLLRYLQKDGVPARKARDPDNARIQASREVGEVEEYV